MRRRKGLEYWGDFWLESEPDRKVPGHLTFDARRGGTLLLHSTLQDDGRPPGRRPYGRIMGQILGRSCVLLDCFDSGETSSEAGPGQWEVNVRISMTAVLLVPRQHADSPAERFTSASASFHGLPEFDGRMPFKHGREHTDNHTEVTGNIGETARTDDNDRTMRLTATTLEPRTVVTDRMTIEFVQGAGSKSKDFKAATLVSRHWMRVTPDEALPLDDLVECYNQARTLIAIAMHQDCKFNGPLYLQPEVDTNERDADDHYLGSYEYHARWRTGRRHSHELYNRVLSFDSLGPDGIARWLALEHDCGHVIGRLSSIRFTKSLAYEDALLRVVAAADSLHRVVFPQTAWVKSRTMLTELAEYAGYPFQAAVPDLHAWSHAVISERDNAAHNKGLDVARPTMTTQLVESVYFLVLVALLRRAEAPDSAFEGLRQSQPFLWSMRDIFRTFGDGSDWIARMGKSSGRLGG